jgi:hypothetical protein
MLFSRYVLLDGRLGLFSRFCSVLRLREQLAKLITNQATRIKDPAQSLMYLSTTYELLLSRLSVS